MSLRRHLVFISDNDRDKDLLCSLLMVLGDRSGARWVYGHELPADVIMVDTDHHAAHDFFRQHADSIVVGFGSEPDRGTHFHLYKPLKSRPLLELLVSIVHNDHSNRDEIVRHYLNELNHAPVTLDVLVEVVHQLSSGTVDKESIARHMGISGSTLQRRLAAEGASFRQLLNATRRDLAERYLREGRRPIKEVAYSLGFADLSNFTRAFRSWFGMSPREYQRAARASGASPA